LWRYFGSSCELERTRSDPHQAPQRRELEVSDPIRVPERTRADCDQHRSRDPGTLHIATTADLTLATPQSP
jgi:hypothetical protein